MKAFRFPLDPALRWRATQLRVEQESLSRATGRVAALQKELISKHTELRAGSIALASAGSVAFASWAAYAERSHRQIRALEDQLRQARQTLTVQTRKMLEANQKVHALQNLKNDEHAGWAKQQDHETEAFAGEAFLAGLARTRARDAEGRKPAE